MRWEELIMKSEMSFFHKGIFTKDIKRLWPLWTLALVACLFGLLTLSLVFNGASSEVDRVEAIVYMCEFVSSPLLIAIETFVVSCFVFGYIYKKRSSFSIHALPIRRETLFGSHYASGLAILVVPYLLGYLLMLCFALGNGERLLITLVCAFIESIVEILLFYNISCCVLMVSGNRVVATAIYCVINFLYVFFVFLYSTAVIVFTDSGLVDFGIYGTETRSVFTCGSPLIFLFSRDICTLDYNKEILNMRQCTISINVDLFYQTLLYLIPAVILFVLALVIYRKRKMETQGNMMSFEFSAVAFKVVFSICIGFFISIFSFLVIDSVLTLEYYFYKKMIAITIFVFFLVGMVLGYFVSEMIIQKRFKVFRTFGKKTFFSMLGIFVVLFVLLKFDVLTFYSVSESDINRVRIDYNGQVYNLTGREDIEKFISLMDEMKKEDSYNEEYEITRFHYSFFDDTDKDEYEGILQTRPQTSVSKEFESFLMNPNKIVTRLFGTDKLPVEHCRFYYNISSEEKECPVEYRQQLFEAICKDLQEGNINLFDEHGDYVKGEFYTIEIWSNRGVDNNMERRIELIITEKAVNTISELYRIAL